MVEITRRVVPAVGRVVLTLFLTFTFASSLAADCYQRNIAKCAVVTLDGNVIEASAKSGTPFGLVLGKTSLNVVLWPAPVWPKEGLPVLEIRKDGLVTQQIVTGNVTYAGEVVGEDPAKSEARFTIARGVLEGYVRSSTGWWFLEPLARFDPKAGPGKYLVYATRDVNFALDYGQDGVHSDTVYDRNGRIGMVMVADALYASLSDPFMWWERQASLLNKVNGIYRDQVGRSFKLDYSLVDAQDRILTSTNATVLLHVLTLWVNFMGGVDGLNTHIVHLTTAKDLDGDALGIAFEPGEVGLSQQAIGTLDFQNTMVAAHEIGHNFSGTHGQAEDRCPGEDVCLSLMFFIFLPSNVPEFSDGTIDPNNNNRQMIINNMSSRGF
jgi:reprolysin-like metallo-peptidase family M12B